MRVVDKRLIEGLRREAVTRRRKRANCNFHQSEDVMQRMVKVLADGTYVPPHKHEDPDKIEHFVLIEGEVAVVEYDDDGQISEWVVMSESSGVRAVDLLPGKYHNLVCMSTTAVLMEFVEGPYDENTHKKPAPFAPAESDETAGRYLEQVEQLVREK